MRKWLILPLVLYVTNLYALDTFSYALKHRTAIQLEHVLSPLLQDNEKLVAHENTLILSLDTERADVFKDLIEKLDVPMQNVMITFSMGHDRPDIHFKQYEADVKDFNEYDRHYKRKQIGTSHAQKRNIKSIRVLNGESAKIETDYVIALLDYQAAADGSGQHAGNSEASRLKQVFDLNYPIYEENTSDNSGDNGNNNDSHSESIIGYEVTEKDARAAKSKHSGSRNHRFYEFAQHYESYKDALYVSPNLIENNVLIEITAFEGQSQANPIPLEDHHYSQSRMITKVLLPLNEWVYLGGNRNPNDMLSEGYRYHTRSKSEDKHHIWIKVERLN